MLATRMIGAQLTGGTEQREKRELGEGLERGFEDVVRRGRRCWEVENDEALRLKMMTFVDDFPTRRLRQNSGSRLFRG